MNGECFASNKYFADLYGKSKTTISKWVSELVKEGYVEVKLTYKEGTKQIDKRYIQIKKGASLKKQVNPLLENAKDNNTIVNNNTTYSNKKPTVEEIKQYCLQRNNGIDAEQFFDFYESKNWYVGKNKMKNWQAAIRTWEKRKTKTSKIDAQLDNYNNAKKHLGL